MGGPPEWENSFSPLANLDSVGDGFNRTVQGLYRPTPYSVGDEFGIDRLMSAHDQELSTVNIKPATYDRGMPHFLPEKRSNVWESHIPHEHYSNCEIMESDERERRLSTHSSIDDTRSKPMQRLGERKADSNSKGHTYLSVAEMYEERQRMYNRRDEEEMWQQEGRPYRESRRQDGPSWSRKPFTQKSSSKPAVKTEMTQRQYPHGGVGKRKEKEPVQQMKMVGDRRTSAPSGSSASKALKMQAPTSKVITSKMMALTATSKMISSRIQGSSPTSVSIQERLGPHIPGMGSVQNRLGPRTGDVHDRLGPEDRLGHPPLPPPQLPPEGVHFRLGPEVSTPAPLVETKSTSLSSQTSITPNLAVGAHKSSFSVAGNLERAGSEPDLRVELQERRYSKMDGDSMLSSRSTPSPPVSGHPFHRASLSSLSETPSDLSPTQLRLSSTFLSPPSQPHPLEMTMTSCEMSLSQPHPLEMRSSELSLSQPHSLEMTMRSSELSLSQPHPLEMTMRSSELCELSSSQPYPLEMTASSDMFLSEVESDSNEGFHSHRYAHQPLLTGVHNRSSHCLQSDEEEGRTLQLDIAPPIIPSHSSLPSERLGLGDSETLSQTSRYPNHESRIPPSSPPPNQRGCTTVTKFPDPRRSPSACYSPQSSSSYYSSNSHGISTSIREQYLSQSHKKSTNTNKLSSLSLPLGETAKSIKSVGIQGRREDPNALKSSGGSRGPRSDGVIEASRKSSHPVTSRSSEVRMSTNDSLKRKDCPVILKNDPIKSRVDRIASKDRSIMPMPIPVVSTNLIWSMNDSVRANDNSTRINASPKTTPNPVAIQVNTAKLLSGSATNRSHDSATMEHSPLHSRPQMMRSSSDSFPETQSSYVVVEQRGLSHPEPNLMDCGYSKVGVTQTNVHEEGELEEGEIVDSDSEPGLVIDLEGNSSSATAVGACLSENRRATESRSISKPMWRDSDTRTSGQLKATRLGSVVDSRAEATSEKSSAVEARLLQLRKTIKICLSEKSKAVIAHNSEKLKTSSTRTMEYPYLTKTSPSEETKVCRMRPLGEAEGPVTNPDDETNAPKMCPSKEPKQTKGNLPVETEAYKTGLPEESKALENVQTEKGKFIQVVISGQAQPHTPTAPSLLAPRTDHCSSSGRSDDLAACIAEESGNFAKISTLHVTQLALGRPLVQELSSKKGVNGESLLKTFQTVSNVLYIKLCKLTAEKPPKNMNSDAALAYIQSNLPFSAIGSASVSRLGKIVALDCGSFLLCDLHAACQHIGKDVELWVDYTMSYRSKVKRMCFTFLREYFPEVFQKGVKSLCLHVAEEKLRFEGVVKTHKIVTPHMLNKAELEEGSPQRTFLQEAREMYGTALNNLFKKASESQNPAVIKTQSEASSPALSRTAKLQKEKIINLAAKMIGRALADELSSCVLEGSEQNVLQSLYLNSVRMYGSLRLVFNRKKKSGINIDLAVCYLQSKHVGSAFASSGVAKLGKLLSVSAWQFFSHELHHLKASFVDNVSKWKECASNWCQSLSDINHTMLRSLFPESKGKGLNLHSQVIHELRQANGKKKPLFTPEDQPIGPTFFETARSMYGERLMQHLRDHLPPSSTPTDDHRASLSSLQSVSMDSSVTASVPSPLLTSIQTFLSSVDTAKCAKVAASSSSLPFDSVLPSLSSDTNTVVPSSTVTSTKAEARLVLRNQVEPLPNEAINEKIDSRSSTPATSTTKSSADTKSSTESTHTPNESTNEKRLSAVSISSQLPGKQATEVVLMTTEASSVCSSKVGSATHTATQLVQDHLMADESNLPITEREKPHSIVEERSKKSIRSSESTSLSLRVNRNRTGTDKDQVGLGVLRKEEEEEKLQESKEKEEEEGEVRDNDKESISSGEIISSTPSPSGCHDNTTSPTSRDHHPSLHSSHHHVGVVSIEKPHLFRSDYPSSILTEESKRRSRQSLEAYRKTHERQRRSSSLHKKWWERESEKGWIRAEFGRRGAGRDATASRSVTRARRSWTFRSRSRSFSPSWRNRSSGRRRHRSHSPYAHSNSPHTHSSYGRSHSPYRHFNQVGVRSQQNRSRERNYDERERERGRSGRRRVSEGRRERRGSSRADSDEDLEVLQLRKEAIMSMLKDNGEEGKEREKTSGRKSTEAEGGGGKTVREKQSEGGIESKVIVKEEGAIASVDDPSVKIGANVDHTETSLREKRGQTKESEDEQKTDFSSSAPTDMHGMVSARQEMSPPPPPTSPQNISSPPSPLPSTPLAPLIQISPPAPPGVQKLGPSQTSDTKDKKSLPSPPPPPLPLPSAKVPKRSKSAPSPVRSPKSSNALSSSLLSSLPTPSLLSSLPSSLSSSRRSSPVSSRSSPAPLTGVESGQGPSGVETASLSRSGSTLSVLPTPSVKVHVYIYMNTYQGCPN